MKKLTFIFALVVLCITAKAQDRSQLVGKWKLDKQLTMEHNPQLKEAYENGTEKQKEVLGQFFKSWVMEFEDNGDFSSLSIEGMEVGTWQLENDILELVTDGKTQHITISSLKSNYMILVDHASKLKFGFKRKE